MNSVICLVGLWAVALVGLVGCGSDPIDVTADPVVEVVGTESTTTQAETTSSKEPTTTEAQSTTTQAETTTTKEPTTTTEAAKSIHPGECFETPEGGIVKAYFAVENLDDFVVERQMMNARVDRLTELSGDFDGDGSADRAQFFQLSDDVSVFGLHVCGTTSEIPDIVWIAPNKGKSGARVEATPTGAGDRIAVGEDTSSGPWISFYEVISGSLVQVESRALRSDESGF